MKPKNIEDVTSQENKIHAYSVGLQEKGEKYGRAVLTEKQIKEIRKKYIPNKYSLSMLTKEYGVSVKTIYFIVQRKNWSHV